MIPAFVLVVAYVTASALLIFTIGADFRWVSPPRIFFAVVLLGWAGFYMLIAFGYSNLDVMVVLSRWLHLPTAFAVSLIAGSRWYHERKWGNGE